MKKISNPAKIILLVAIMIIVIVTYKKTKSLKNKTKKSLNFSHKKTWDIHSDKLIDTLHPSIQKKARELLIVAYERYNIKLRVTSALRTWEEQTILYNQGRTTPGKIVSNAQKGESYHNYGLSFDLVEIKNGKALWSNDNWAKIGEIGKSLGFSWGGDWKFVDKPHFQMTFGKHHSKLAQLYRQGKRNGNYVFLT